MATHRPVRTPPDHEQPPRKAKFDDEVEHGCLPLGAWHVLAHIGTIWPAHEQLMSGAAPTRLLPPPIVCAAFLTPPSTSQGTARRTGHSRSARSCAGSRPRAQSRTAWRLSRSARLDARRGDGRTDIQPRLTDRVRRVRCFSRSPAPSGRRWRAGDPCHSRVLRGFRSRTRNSAPRRWRRPGRIPGRGRNKCT